MITLYNDTQRNGIYHSLGKSSVYSFIINRIASTDANGRLVFNWHEIGKMLSKDAGDITKIQYYALASAYAVMDTENLQKFIQLLGDKKGDHGWHVGQFLTPEAPSTYTAWEYGHEKIDGLKRSLELHIASLKYQRQLADDLKFIGSDEIVTALNDQRYDIIKKYSLLNALQKISNTSVSFISGVASILEFKGFNGRESASHPEISLSKNKAGNYELTYYNSHKITVPNGSGGTNSSIDNFNKNTMTIHAAFIEKCQLDNIAVSENMGKRIMNAIQAGAAGDFGKDSIGAIPIAGDLSVLGWELAEEAAKNSRD